MSERRRGPKGVDSGGCSADGPVLSVTEGAILEIKNLIVDGALRPGDRLPTQDRLATQLGLSRSSLREAVSALTLLGVLDARQGDGLHPRVGLDSQPGRCGRSCIPQVYPTHPAGSTALVMVMSPGPQTRDGSVAVASVDHRLAAAFAR